MHKLVFIFTLILFSCFTDQLVAQNIIRNSGFEENTGCPGATVFLNKTKFWSSVQNHQGTPDLFWKDCPYNGVGNNRMAPNQLTIEVWDNNVEDGDIVRILINEKILSEGLVIKKRAQTLTYELSENDNLLVIQALNLGSRPPNTLALKITDGRTSKKIIFTTDLQNAHASKVILKN